MSESDAKYFSMILEEIRDQNKVLLEAFSGMRDELNRLPKREEFDELKQDVKVIKATVTDLSGQVSNHETRITRLETA